jgi:pimeloyl-ACP methyl ester carboxylesterase
MLAQIRGVLDSYAAAGGKYTEEVFPECGHSPHIEHQDRFVALVGDFLASA